MFSERSYIPLISSIRQLCLHQRKAETEVLKGEYWQVRRKNMMHSSDFSERNHLPENKTMLTRRLSIRTCHRHQNPLLCHPFAVSGTVSFLPSSALLPSYHLPIRSSAGISSRSASCNRSLNQISLAYFGQEVLVSSDMARCIYGKSSRRFNQQSSERLLASPPAQNNLN